MEDVLTPSVCSYENGLHIQNRSLDDGLDTILPYYVTTLVDPSVWVQKPSHKNDNNWHAHNKHSRRMPDYACQQFPDYFSTVNTKLNASEPVNLTCWTTAPAADKRVACDDNGAAWFRTAEGCYIPDFIIVTDVKAESETAKNGVSELTDLLRFCPSPVHQVGAMKPQYQEVGTYCYACASLGCGAVPVPPSNGSVELDCWKSGETVRGDE
jgi:hypothetical protein